MIEKKLYEKPSMQVFDLRQQPQLLQASAQVDATMDGTWTEETI